MRGKRATLVRLSFTEFRSSIPIQNLSEHHLKSPSKMPLDSIISGLLSNALWWYARKQFPHIKDSSSELAKRRKEIDLAMEEYFKQFARRRNPAVLPVTLPSEKFLSELYVEQFLRRCATKREQSAQDQDDDDCDISAIPCLRGANHSVVLGRPGSGKSALLVQYVIQTLSTQSTPPVIPVIIDAAQFGSSRGSIAEYVLRRIQLDSVTEGESMLETMLTEGAFSILWDGLDEVSSRVDLRHVLDAVKQLWTAKPKCMQVVTSRNGFYEDWLPEFSAFELQPLQETQIMGFVENWFQSEPRRINPIKKMIRQSDIARDMADSPLLLSLICVASEEALFPVQSRTELLDRSVSALLTRWDARKIITREDEYCKLGIADKRALLSFLGHNRLESSQSFWKESELGPIVANRLHKTNPGLGHEIDGMSIVRNIHSLHGILEQREYNTWAFSHWAFEEYFAALYIHENKGPSEFHPFVIRALDEPRKRGVALNLLCMLQDCNDALTALLSLVTTRINTDYIVQLGSRIDQEMSTVRAMTSVVSRHLVFELVLQQVVTVAAYVDEWAQFAGATDREKLVDLFPAWLKKRLRNSDDGSHLPQVTPGMLSKRKRPLVFTFDRYQEILQEALEAARTIGSQEYVVLDPKIAKLYDLSAVGLTSDDWALARVQWGHFRQYGEVLVRSLKDIGFIFELCASRPRVSSELLERCMTEPSNILSAAMEQFPQDS